MKSQAVHEEEVIEQIEKLNPTDVELTYMFAKSYSLRYMKSQNIYEEDVIEQIEKLNPTDVELTYMFAQTCFQYAGNRFQGEIMSITDRF
ncbi:hypothetical protein B9Z55_017425 [Caenorhabditis nigoni]|uniref:NR LBD domain-containing protein n=1 Tax=Caenorhabditis nigoni TaxID=1611254 RepID=A0A2G5T918_9PELO|nr:hypothetical protein B9Z55_017425 [Caenorhabditis nigoni]